jgi:hypothetical protein
MITKTKIWKKIKLQLKEVERSKSITEQVMKRIKEISQDENKD